MKIEETFPLYSKLAFGLRSNEVNQKRTNVRPLLSLLGSFGAIEWLSWAFFCHLHDHHKRGHLFSHGLGVSMTRPFRKGIACHGSMQACPFFYYGICCFIIWWRNVSTRYHKKFCNEETFPHQSDQNYKVIPWTCEISSRGQKKNRQLLSVRFTDLLTRIIKSRLWELFQILVGPGVLNPLRTRFSSRQRLQSSPSFLEHVPCWILQQTEKK